MTGATYTEQEIEKLKTICRALAIKHSHLSSDELQKKIIEFSMTENLKSLPVLRNNINNDNS